MLAPIQLELHRIGSSPFPADKVIEHFGSVKRQPPVYHLDDSISRSVSSRQDSVMLVFKRPQTIDEMSKSGLL
jgi:hypothetical protein